MQKLQSFIECLMRALVFGWGSALRGGRGGGEGGSIAAFRGIFASAGEIFMSGAGTLGNGSMIL